MRIVAALSAAALTLLAACSDTMNPEVKTEISRPQFGLSGGTGIAAPIVSRLNSNLCLDVSGGTATAGARVAVRSCSGGSNQRFTWQSNGEIRVFGSLCLDAAGGQGKDGDPIMIWGCHGGANQKWSASAAGEIKGINGKCIDIYGGQARSGDPVVLWSCHGGLNQKWDNPSSGGGSSGRLFGVHNDVALLGWSWQRAPVITRAKAINARVARSSLLWNNIERQKGVRDWQVPDGGINDLVAAGIEPLMTIWGSPSWASGVSTSNSDYWKYVPTDNTGFRTWLDNYKAFVRDAVIRYKGKVKKWELWNEPNEHWCWKPAPDVDRYVTWYREIYQTIKSVDPSADVAMGGLTGLSAAGPQDITGKRFLEAVYARGVYPDIVAIHPYAMKQQAPDVTLQWENNFTDIEMIYNVMKAYGQGSRQIWATEWGWLVGGVSEATQAVYVQQALTMLTTKYTYVTLSTYFLDIDTPAYSQGLFAIDGRMRASGARFRDFAATH
jgi:ricin-type beta-trefoil lectin protein/glycosyl hydrolase family 39 (putative alpha-L-iduronidase)